MSCYIYIDYASLYLDHHAVTLASLYFDTHVSLTTRHRKRYVIFTTHKSTREGWHFSFHDISYIYIDYASLYLDHHAVTLAFLYFDTLPLSIHVVS